MAEILFRPAQASDAASIKAIIRLVRINPTGLDWRRFLVAVSGQGELIACAQIKPHGDGTLELASLAVHPGWRGRGLARDLIGRLLAGSPRPIYLTCRSGLEPFYEKFGFRALLPAELPPYFRRLQRVAGALMGVFRDGETLSVMRRDE